MNFFIGDSIRISSLIPKKKITIKQAMKYWKTLNTSCALVKSNTPNMKPTNIPSPPKEGTGAECTFLSPGRSYNFFQLATKMMTGIE
jgi:hypothetical protein